MRSVRDFAALKRVVRFEGSLSRFGVRIREESHFEGVVLVWSRSTSSSVVCQMPEAQQRRTWTSTLHLGF